MTTTVLPPVTADSGRPLKDATVLLCTYVLVLCALPAKLVLQGIPLDLAPTMLFGLGIGVLWFCAQQVDTLGVAKGRNVVRTVLFCYAITQLLTYGAATYSGLPADELKATDRTLITLFSVIAAGLAAVDGLRTRKGVELVLKCMVLGATFMSFVGILQSRLGVDLTDFLTLPGLRSVSTEETILERSIFRRPSGTAGHPIEYGVMCAFTAPLALYFAFRANRRREPRQWLWWCCFAVISGGIMFSLSRSAILGAAVAGLVLFYSWSWRVRVRMAIAAGVFLVIMRILVPGLVGTLIALFSNFSQDNSIKGRLVDYAPTSLRIERYPWLGHGVGTNLPLKYGWLDNQYMMTLLDNGIVGLFALVAVFLSGIYAALRVRSLTGDPELRDLAMTLVACLSVPTVAAITFDMLAYALITGLVFLTVGACGALLRHQREPVGSARAAGSSARIET
ncbi:O-antigen ligase family protein [Nonomuraea sp. KM88]|uniref:O-antigen ligase family protein n=1 Tax=Nonomuraea sp. KM88 TaxID=3457427 RepID=UPI003FCC5185